MNDEYDDVEEYVRWIIGCSICLALASIGGIIAVVWCAIAIVRLWL